MRDMIFQHHRVMCPEKDLKEKAIRSITIFQKDNYCRENRNVTLLGVYDDK